MSKFIIFFLVLNVFAFIFVFIYAVISDEKDKKNNIEKNFFKENISECVYSIKMLENIPVSKIRHFKIEIVKKSFINEKGEHDFGYIYRVCGSHYKKYGYKRIFYTKKIEDAKTIVNKVKKFQELNRIINFSIKDLN